MRRTSSYIHIVSKNGISHEHHPSNIRQVYPESNVLYEFYSYFHCMKK